MRSTAGTVIEKCSDFTGVDSEDVSGCRSVVDVLSSLLQQLERIVLVCCVPSLMRNNNRAS